MLTHSPNHSPTCSLAHSPTHSSTHSLTHAPNLQDCLFYVNTQTKKQQYKSPFDPAIEKVDTNAPCLHPYPRLSHPPPHTDPSLRLHRCCSIDTRPRRTRKWEGRCLHAVGSKKNFLNFFLNPMLHVHSIFYFALSSVLEGYISVDLLGIT